MTKQEVEASLSGNLNTLYSIELSNGTVINGFIEGPYLGHPNDSRGLNEPYIHVKRVDVAGGYETNRCSDISKINLL